MPKNPRKVLVLQSIQDRHPNPDKYTLKTLPLGDIVPSPFQNRKDFDPDKLQELAGSIIQDGLISPILVRPMGEYFELIAGERRLRAVRDYTNKQTIEARIVETDDIGARRLSAAENIQREDLTVFETIEAIVELVDAELMADREYASMGHDSVDRVKALLGKLDTVRRSEQRKSRISDDVIKLSHRFMGQVHEIFQNLPKSLEWRSFYSNDLNLLVDTAQEVRDVSIQHKLNKSQTRALGKLNRVSKDQFEAFVQESALSENN
jgi:ParB/RepB/Spo0J family partition protein